MTLITELISKSKLFLTVFFGAVCAFLGYRLSTNKAEKETAIKDAKENERIVENIIGARQINDTISNLDSGDVHNKLQSNNWYRD